MKARSLLLLALSLLLLSAGACASSGTTSRANYDPNLITEAELEALDVSNVYDAVQRLRPRWLTAERARTPPTMGMGTRVVAFLNTTNIGGFEALRDISLEGVASVRYLNNAEAVARLPNLGSGHVGAAIVVSTR